MHVKEQDDVVIAVGDGIIWIKGLPSATIEDILVFDDGSRVMVFDLNRELIGAILLYETVNLTAGTLIHLAKNSLSMSVGDIFLGRVIDPQGKPLDGRSKSEHVVRGNLEQASPPIIAREFVRDDPLYTGIKIIDTLIPIGKGQR